MTRSIGERGKEWSAFERVQRQRIREHRAKAEQFIAELKSFDDAQLMLLYDEQFRDYTDELERAKAMGKDKVGMSRVHLDVLRHVAIKRGLMRLPPEEREFYEWMDREFSHPAGMIH
jgi:hypothetical protein